MNVDHSTALDWRAIAAGAGASIAIGMSASFLIRPLFASGSIALGDGTMLAINGLVSMLADSIGGATAGLLAKRRGAMHGLLAMLLASAFGLAISMVMLARYGQLQVMLGLAWWLQWLGMAILGAAIGTLAGFIAARVAAGKST